MNAWIAGLGSVTLVTLGVSFGSTAMAQDQVPVPPPQAPMQAAPPADQEAPPASSWVATYPTGQWVYTADHGSIWVPAGATTRVVADVPYAYLYTPAYGWTWYASPWGPGRYHYGRWVVHPVHHAVWRAGWAVGRGGPGHVVVRGAGHGYHRR